MVCVLTVIMLLFYVFMSLKSLSGIGTCLSFIIVHFCLLTFFVVLEEMRQATSASNRLYIFIGSVPGLRVQKVDLL